MNIRNRSIVLTAALLSLPTDLDAATIKEIDETTPDKITRFATDKVTGEMVLSRNEGPQTDGKLEGIDCIEIDFDTAQFDDVNRAIVHRIQSTRGLDSRLARYIHVNSTAYLDKHDAKQFANGAIRDMKKGGDLNGKWYTIVTVEYNDGRIEFSNLRFVSIQKKIDGGYVMQNKRRVAVTDGNQVLKAVLDNTVQKILVDVDFKLPKGAGKSFLVRTLGAGTFTVVTDNKQYVYGPSDSDKVYEVIAEGNVGETMYMGAIDPKGNPILEMAQGVTGSGNKWGFVTTDVDKTDFAATNQSST
ncbi:hypothetical protein HOI18_03025 [Candidatus Uhrbacteria bacterium]|nr:hypothetical protein [Candidatus Uhrbacteria bacterium]